MGTGKQRLIGAGFAFFRATRLHDVLAPLTKGQGAILMLHHVRPWRGNGFAPNRLLEVEPTFLDAALTRIKALGFDVVSLDDGLERLGQKKAKRFVTLTFDDGYRDNVTDALPILERHGAPFTLFVTTGFVDRSARLWWVELEEAIRARDQVAVMVDGAKVVLPARTAGEKQVAFQTMSAMLRHGPETRRLAVVGDLLSQAGLSSSAITDRLCLDWVGVEALSRHPLCTIGVHTLTHPMLATQGVEQATRELAESRRLIEARIDAPARHLAYPFGDSGSAAAREFGMAAALGFASAVTTRPGMLFPGHRHHRHALPRLSLNGHWQTLDSLEVLLSGVPFALWNKGRRLNVSESIFRKVADFFDRRDALPF